MLEHVRVAHEKYDEEKDSNIVREDDGVRDEEPEIVFKAGQSKRIWNELYKVSIVCATAGEEGGAGRSVENRSLSVINNSCKKWHC